MTIDERATDAVFEVLADGHRRTLVAYLRRANEATVEELATAIEAQESEFQGDDPVIRLSHVHLPKMADAGLIEYERSSGQVEYVGGSEITDLLTTTPDRPHPR